MKLLQFILSAVFKWGAKSSDPAVPAATGKSRLLGVVQGVNITEDGSGKVTFTADADIDCDGSGGNPDNDPYFQPDTTLHNKGRALDAYQEKFIVVPPLVVRETKGIVMGCLAKVTNTLNGKTIWAVVGDLGPTKKVGELSVAAARALGINGNPNIGGESRKVIRYEIWPGTPAVVDGISYSLQARS